MAMTRVLPWRKGMMIGAAALLLLLIAAAPMASAGWSYYKTIKIDHTKVQGTLTNFPVLISITDSSGLGTYAQDDGDDIVFTDSINSMKLDHEIEEFQKSSGKLVAWVRVPSLTDGSDYTMRMYYGNPSCGNQQNPTGVWDTYYKMVQHLEETEDQPITDSTVSYNNQNNPGVGSGCFLKEISGETFASGQLPIPELSTLLLFSLGLVALTGYVYVRKRK